MLGLSVEKIILIGVIAAVVIGPERLPRYASMLATFVRNFRDFTTATKAKAESELGVPLDTDAWNRNVRRYDPRTIVKDALAGQDATAEPAAPADTPVAAPVSTPVSAPDTAVAARTPVVEPAVEPVVAPEPVMRERWVIVGGSSGHPVRRRVLEPVPVDEAAEATEAAGAPSAAPDAADSGDSGTAATRPPAASPLPLPGP